MAVELTTDRLRLRALRDSDAADYQRLVGERPEHVRRDDDEDATIDNIRLRIASQRAVTTETGLALLAIVRVCEHDFIGYCGLTVGRSSLDEPELAYELLRRVHGHGYATEAARAVVAAAAATGRRRLWATLRSWNAPSFRVLEKLEFERHHVSPGEDAHGELVWMTRTLP
jgi:RimJ/RimL family protein N-acetyltransferase